MTTFSEIVKSKKAIYGLLLIGLLMPTYFIHSPVYPDWGDDFAQYIYQGQQIRSPSPVYKQVFNLEGYSSPKRSVFFSVVLSIIEPTLVIQHYVNVTSVFYILAGLCFFLFLSRHFSLAVSVTGSLALFYNFLFLRLKSEVVPEFLFISLFCLILYLTYSRRMWVKYAIPVLLGLLVSVRFVGLSLLFAYIISLALSKDLNLKQKIKGIIVCLILFGVVVLCINRCFISVINNQEVGLYGNIVRNGYEWHMLLDNICAYGRYILYFFEQEIPYWMNIILTIIVCSFFAAGFFMSVRININILHFAFILYFLFLFFYPYKSDTIKYLIPAVPLFFYFMIYGAELFLKKLSLKNTHSILVAGLIIILFSNSNTVWLAQNHYGNKIGPYDQEVLDDFDKVKKAVGYTKSIASGKPFVVNLLCDRNSYFVSEKNHQEVFTKADYFLSPKESIEELCPKNRNIVVAQGDTISLTHFYLIKLSKSTL
jgi:hypothetical protein